MKEFEFYSNECGCPVCGTYLIFPTTDTTWHDAKTDPPKEDGDYYVEALSYSNSTYTEIAYWDGDWGDTKVLRWTPKPEPPKESEG